MANDSHKRVRQVISLSVPSILCIFTSDRPIGQGLCGDRVENTPRRSPPSRGGATFAGTLVLSVA